MPAAFLCPIEREIAGLWVQSTGRLFLCWMEFRLVPIYCIAGRRHPHRIHLCQYKSANFCRYRLSSGRRAERCRGNDPAPLELEIAGLAADARIFPLASFASSSRNAPTPFSAPSVLICAEKAYCPAPAELSCDT